MNSVERQCKKLCKFYRQCQYLTGPKNCEYFEEFNSASEKVESRKEYKKFLKKMHL